MNKFTVCLISKLSESTKVRYASFWEFWVVVQIQPDFVVGWAVKNFFFNVNWAVKEDRIFVSEIKIALDPKLLLLLQQLTEFFHLIFVLLIRFSKGLIVLLNFCCESINLVNDYFNFDIFISINLWYFGPNLINHRIIVVVVDVG